MDFIKDINKNIDLVAVKELNGNFTVYEYDIGKLIRGLTIREAAILLRSEDWSPLHYIVKP